MSCETLEGVATSFFICKLGVMVVIIKKTTTNRILPLRQVQCNRPYPHHLMYFLP